MAEHRLNFRLDSSSAPTRVRLHGGRSRALNPCPLGPAILAATETDAINPITSPSSGLRLSLSLPPSSNFQEPVKWSGRGGRNSGEMIARGLLRSSAAASQVMVSRSRPRKPAICFTRNLKQFPFSFYEIRFDPVVDMQMRFLFSSFMSEKRGCFFFLRAVLEQQIEQRSAAFWSLDEPSKNSLLSSVLLWTNTFSPFYLVQLHWNWN